MRSKRTLKSVFRSLSALTILGLPVAVASPPAIAATAQPPAQQPVQQTAVITMDDTGVTQNYVLITVGGTVKWTNTGTTPHTATTQGNAPLPFDTGGIGPSESGVIQFYAPGTYWYTSSTDCEFGVPNHGFNCGPYAIGVTSAAATVLNAVAPPPPATPVPTPAPALQSSTNSTAVPLTVAITDQGFVPPQVSIPVNGAVTFVNNGANLHTVTSRGGAPQAFESGGMPHGAIYSVSFYLPGTYAYSSSPDCLQGSPPQPGFVCGSFSIIVGGTPAPAAAPVAGAVGTTSVSIDDVKGFQPKSITVRAGQTVTWTNTGSQVHSVVADNDPLTGKPMLPAIDSGGLGPQQTFSYTFTQAGTLTYHSSTDVASWVGVEKYGFPTPVYSFTGSIAVQ